MYQCQVIRTYINDLVTRCTNPDAPFHAHYVYTMSMCYIWQVKTLDNIARFQDRTAIAPVLYTKLLANQQHYGNHGNGLKK